MHIDRVLVRQPSHPKYYITQWCMVLAVRDFQPLSPECRAASRYVSYEDLDPLRNFARIVETRFAGLL
jgi:hypothetical protein